MWKHLYNQHLSSPLHPFFENGQNSAAWTQIPACLLDLFASMDVHLIFPSHADGMNHEHCQTPSLDHDGDDFIEGNPVYDLNPGSQTKDFIISTL